MKTYKIYQLKNDSQIAHGIKFFGLEELKKFGMMEKLTLDIYNMVYVGEIEDGEITTVLNRIYSLFQGVKPEGFHGCSISVSDIVEMDGKYYYCDSYSWEEIALPETDTLSNEEFMEFFKEQGSGLFGRYTEEIGKLIADDVIEEYKESGNRNLQQAVAYIIGEKWGMMDGL